MYPSNMYLAAEYLYRDYFKSSVRRNKLGTWTLRVLAFEFMGWVQGLGFWGFHLNPGKFGIVFSAETSKKPCAPEKRRTEPEHT